MAGKMWLANADYGAWVPCPSIEMPSGTQKWGASGQFLNGGAYVRRSITGARVFEMNWPMKHQHELDTIESFFEGAYGEGPFFVAEPASIAYNMFPAYLATPGMGVSDGPTLLYDKRPAKATFTRANGEPILGAAYNKSASDLVNKFTLAIPKGYTLHTHIQATPDTILASNMDGSPAYSSVLYAFTGLADQSTSTRTKDGVTLTNLITNPRGRDTSGTVVVRENLAAQPWGYGVRNSSVTTVENGVAITDHPLGIATAHESRLTEGVTSAILLSSYNVGGGGDFTEPVWAGTWVKVNAPGYQARMGSGESYEPIPANEWVFIRTTSARTDWVSTHIQTDDLRTVAPEDRAWLTGTITSKTPIAGPEDYLDGNYSPDTDLTPVWTGTAGESTSQLTAPNPVGWSLSTGSGVTYYSARNDAVAVYSDASSPSTASSTATDLVAGQRATVVVEALAERDGLSTLIRTGGSVEDVGNGPTVPLGRGEWTRVSRGLVSTGGGSTNYIYNYQAPAPSTLYFRAALIDGTDTYDGERFDGHTANVVGGAADGTREWEGGRLLQFHLNPAYEGTAVVYSMCAVAVPDGEPFDIDAHVNNGNFPKGKGTAGMEPDGDFERTTYSAALDRFHGSVRLVEVEPWL